MRSFFKYLILILLILAISVLLTSKIGILTIPGILMAIIGLYFLYKENYIGSATIAIFTSTGSLIVQSYTAFCLSCTITASLFALAGVVGLLQDKGEHLKLNIILICILLVGVFFLSSMLVFYQNPAIQDKGLVLEQKKTTTEEKAKLYISPSCSFCDEYLDYLIEQDILGEKCIVVTVPIRSLAKTQQDLKDKGFKGEVLSTAQSPTNFVPVLIFNEEVLTGSKIKSFLRSE